MPSSKPKGVRAFIALDLPAEAKEGLDDARFDLEDALPEGSVRWMGPNTFHITLFFLGDILEPERIGAVCEFLDELAAETDPFALSLGNFGSFPNQKRPTVLWVGVGGDTKRLKQLKGNVDDGCKGLGWEPEHRAYRPHVTLGRVNPNKGINPRFLPFGSLMADCDWTATHIHLYRSLMTKQGVVYKKIHTAPFRG